MGIADAVVVLDSGALVAEGNPAHVQAMPEVARIYLGEEWLKTKVLPESGDHRVGTI